MQNATKPKRRLFGTLLLVAAALGPFAAVTLFEPAALAAAQKKTNPKKAVKKAAKKAPAKKTAAKTPPPDFAPDGMGWVLMGRFEPVSGMSGPVAADPKDPTQGDAASPLLKPWAREALKRANAMKSKPTAADCTPPGLPLILGFPEPFRILQSPAEIVFVYGHGGYQRHVRLNAQHAADAEPSAFGESVGHYEKGALLVDTVAISTASPADRFGTPHGPAMHVTERYERSDGALHVTYTVEDPATFTTAWSAAADFLPASAADGERGCAAGTPDAAPVATPDF